MFKHIKIFSAIKSLDKKGIMEGLTDMMDQGLVPAGEPFKYENEWMLIIMKYKKIEECQIN